MPPGEHGQAVMVLADQLLDVGPHALELTLQQNEDGGTLTQLQQVQEALSEKAGGRSVTATLASCGGTEK